MLQAAEAPRAPSSLWPQQSRSLLAWSSSKEICSSRALASLASAHLAGGPARESQSVDEMTTINMRGNCSALSFLNTDLKIQEIDNKRVCSDSKSAHDAQEYERGAVRTFLFVLIVVPS